MTERTQDIVHTAAGMLEIAQQRMVGEYPFHVRFIAAWQLHATTAIQTVGVTVQGGAISLFFNPNFVVSCSLSQLMGVLHHEVNHLLFGHVFIDRTRFTDGWALVVAEEVTANEWVWEPLPGSPLLLSQFPQLPANEDTYTRYERLARESKKMVPMGSNASTVNPNLVQPGTIPDHPETLDDHDIWDDAVQSGLVGQMAVRVLTREIAGGLSPEQWQSVPPAIQNRIDTICRGDASGSLYESLTPSATGRLDWRRLLQQYVREATEVRPVFTRPPRRFPELVGIVPGHLHRPTRATVMAVIDTSASMSKIMLEMINGELGRMSAAHTITVVECDATVQRVYRYCGQLSEVCGRAGTNLCPPFDPALLAKVKPDVVVYFTDGYGPAPDAPPSMPVIWCLTPEGQRPAPWGREIRLPSPPVS